MADTMLHDASPSSSSYNDDHLGGFSLRELPTANTTGSHLV